MKRTLSQKGYLSEEFRLLDIRRHITHLQQPKECYYNFVTVAAPFYVSGSDLERYLGDVYSSAECAGIMGSGLGRYIIERFSEDRGCGVALCHYLDRFDQERGCIISEGRLLKILRALGAKRCI